MGDLAVIGQNQSADFADDFIVGIIHFCACQLFRRQILYFRRHIAITGQRLAHRAGIRRRCHCSRISRSVSGRYGFTRCSGITRSHSAVTHLHVVGCRLKIGARCGHDQKEIVRGITRGRIADKFDGVHADRNLTFAHPKETTDINKHRIDVAITRQDHVVDFANVFPAVLHAVILCRVNRRFGCINAHADKRRSAQFHRICRCAEHAGCGGILCQGNTA